VTVLSPVLSVAYSPAGDTVAVGCLNGQVLLVDVATLSIKRSVTVNSRVESVAFSPDGSIIAAAYSNKIQLFDAQTQAKLGSPHGHRYTRLLFC
jgi:WD40 repeat protein